MFRPTIVLVLVLGPALARGDDKKDTTPAELKTFAGAWKFVSIELPGKTEGPTKEAMEQVRIVFRGDTITFKGGPRGDQTATVEIDPSQKPAHITIHPPKDAKKGKPLQAIYKFENNTLTICGSEEERPTEFAVKEETKTRLLVLERVSQKTKEKEKE